MGFTYRVRSDKDTNFTGAVSSAQGTLVEREDLTGLNQNKVRVKQITIQSEQHLGWGIAFWSNDDVAVNPLDLDSDKLCGLKTFAVSDGVRMNTRFVYSASVDIPYVDEDESKELHVALYNTASTPKLATHSGDFAVTFELEDQVGYN